MGYDTYYSLSWKTLDGKPVSPAVNDAIGEYIESHEDINFAVDADGSGTGSCKWYDHTDDMMKMSEAFPGVVFTLHGQGEESEDMWMQYYLDGGVQDAPAKITYPKFDINKVEGRKTRFSPAAPKPDAPKLSMEEDDDDDVVAENPVYDESLEPFEAAEISDSEIRRLFGDAVEAVCDSCGRKVRAHSVSDLRRNGWEVRGSDCRCPGCRKPTRYLFCPTCSRLTGVVRVEKGQYVCTECGRSDFHIKRGKLVEENPRRKSGSVQILGDDQSTQVVSKADGRAAIRELGLTKEGNDPFEPGTRILFVDVDLKPVMLVDLPDGADVYGDDESMCIPVGDQMVVAVDEPWDASQEHDVDELLDRYGATVVFTHN